MKTMKLLFIVTIMLGLCACSSKYPELEDDAIAFEAGDFFDENYPDVGYITIEYNGRVYMPYGTGNVGKKDIDKCIGYIIEDETISSVVDRNSKDTRVYTLTEDKENNYLMVYYIEDQVMNQPSFWRAIDTIGQGINTPKYITKLDDDYWK